jgi:putative cell wall-binding protein
MLDLPREFQDELSQAKKEQKALTLKQKKKTLKKLEIDLETNRASVEHQKQKFIDEIAEKDILLEIKTTKEKKLTFFERLKIILGLK